MEEPYVFVSDWAALEAASPETHEATMAAWYTIPRARKSGFYESEMPQGGDFADYALAFRMIDLAKHDHYAHLDLDELETEARQYIAERTDKAARKRVAEAKLTGHPALQEAYTRGLDVVYSLAGLTDTEKRVAEYVMAGNDNDQIRQAMGYRNNSAARGTIAKVNAKLRALKEGE